MTPTFQRLIDWMLAPHQKYVAAYIDDDIIYTQDRNEHLEAMRAMLQDLWQAGYLGFMEGQRYICPLANKVQALHHYPPICTCKQLRAFLGLTGYCQWFIPQFAEITAPLTDLLQGKSRSPFEWDSMSSQAFEKLKTALCQETVLETWTLNYLSSSRQML